MDLLNLVAKITLDKSEYEKGLRGLAGKAGKTLGTVAKVGAAAVAAGGAAAVAVTKQAIDSYAEYEQLAGGAQLMFGDAYDTVAQNAKDAFSTVQMSQNEYLQQVNGFATGLKTALNGNEQAAADLAHKIIVAEADVVAATGNSREAVENAFNGIMKSNFTMLDNLQIGITPTKEGFQEVIDKVNEWNATNNRATNYQMGNLADMQSALVDYISMVGMAGYAHDEAAGTIQGSIASMKAAWSNLLTGLADGNADIEQLIDDLLVTLIGENGEGGVINNIMPAVERALNGIVKLITTIIPKITPIITDLISQNLPVIVEAGMQLLIALISGIVQGLPQLIETLPVIFETIKTVFMENWPALKEAGSQLLQMIGEGIISALGWLDGKLQEVGLSISNKLDETWQKVKQGAVNVWDNIKTAVAEKVESVKNSIVEKFENIREKIADIIDRIKGIFHFEWEFPRPKLPHFSINWRDLGIISIPDISIEWYKKAYNNPYMFTKPTVMGFGDGNGGEIVYGHNSLLNDIKTAMQTVIGNEQPTTIIVQSVLDGRVIGETATKWQRRQARAFG